jgi:(p)ppGpp synthase/HD superfamily hydrolase
MDELYNKCLEIAKKAHEGQTRKFGDNRPFIVHPLAVADKFTDERTKCIAILHDVIEDSDIDAEKLIQMGVPKDIVHVVEILSKRPDETYFEYIDRVTENKEAMQVKIADIRHNMESAPEKMIKKRYIPALERIASKYSDIGE